MLVANSGVQKELKLDDQQVEKAKKVAEEMRGKMRESFQALQGLDDAERRTKMQEMQRTMQAESLKAIGEILKPEQLARLKQISYQQRGITAFSDPEVQKKLNLTDAQKADIDKMTEEFRTESREIFQQNQDDRAAAMKKVQELSKETLAKAEAKLNDEQQKSWKALLGAPYEFKPDPPTN